MIVKKERCNPIGCGGYLCIRVCPSNRAGNPCIVEDTDGKVKVNEEFVIEACSIDVKKCPYNALQLLNLPQALDEDPIHRYLPNGFALFNLPMPTFGKVTGIMGRNGIGKSTALKILAGLLRPNMGKEGKEATDEELIAYFKGTAGHNFFEKKKNGEIKVAYKPQQVDVIPKQFKGKVSELLKSVDEKGELEKLIPLLDLDIILDRNVDQVSGGELQRVAIAATALKKANVYFFDEPTSYLDIKQRIKISRFIRNLATPDTAVLVVEHDIIILDYLADQVHVMYGEEGAYGIVSGIKAAKVGMNSYLEGYLKEENTRFRNHPIKFFTRPETSGSSRDILASWSSFEHALGSFKLSSQKGELHAKEIVGIVGENGIGKTTFVKIIAGEIPILQNMEGLRISYKPQYLDASDAVVHEFLAEAFSKYENQLITPLRIEDLKEQRLNELSGGELQRVMIAKCLGQEADVYLLDEPSAYLDVEQRLQLSKIIRDLLEFREKSAIIVDHDLLFVDYLSDKLLVFDGRPAIEGVVEGPFKIAEGMNQFLGDLQITMRRDPENNRPRINKIDSQLDREQKSSGKLYTG